MLRGWGPLKGVGRILSIAIGREEEMVRSETACTKGDKKRQLECQGLTQNQKGRPKLTT